MALFSRSKRDPVEQAESSLAEARAARDKVAKRLSAAQELVAERRRYVEEAALQDAADEVLDAADAAMRIASDREQTWTAALSQADARITDAEQALVTAVEQRDRDMVAGGLEELATAIARAYPVYDDAAFSLLQAITQSQASINETQGLVTFLQNSRAEICSACNMIDHALRERAAGIRTGQVRYTISRPAEPDVAIPPKPKAQAERVLSLTHLKWLSDGEVRTCGPYAQVELPAHLLQTALRHHHVDRIDSSRAQTLIAAHGHEWVAPTADDPRLVDLDALALETVAA
jgi:hypothetical protein